MTYSHFKNILLVLVEFFIIISFPFLAWVSKLIFYKRIFCSFWVNLKAKDIHFPDVLEKETIFLVGAWLFYMNQNFLGSKANYPPIKSARGMTAIIFKCRLNFCLKEPLKVHCHVTDCLIWRYKVL